MGSEMCIGGGLGAGWGLIGGLLGRDCWALALPLALILALALACGIYISYASDDLTRVGVGTPARPAELNRTNNQQRL